MRYLLAHDLGTSGNKATLFSEEGKLIKSIVYSYNTNYYNSNWAEQDPNDWWKAVCETTREIVKEVDPADIAAVSFSGQMMGCLCVDKNGNPLRSSIIWADQRAVKEAGFLDEGRGDEDYRLLYCPGHSGRGKRCSRSQKDCAGAVREIPTVQGN